MPLLSPILSRLQRMPPERWLLAALMLAVVGMRLAVFNYAGSPLPYFDQWMAEFDNGFMSASRGYSLAQKLTWSHNEHLLLTTKLLSLLGFSLNGYWDVHFLALASTLVRALAAGAAFSLLTRGLAARPTRVIWLGCLVVFAAPISGFNLLCGLQVSFFLADLALLASLALVVRWKNSWREVALLVGAQLFGLASFGSALAIPACTFAAAWLLRHRAARFWVAWALTATACASYLFVYHDFGAPRAHAFSATFLLSMLSWPFNSSALGGMWLLAALVVIWRLWRAGPVTPARAASIGVLLFAALNATLIALSRRPEEFHHRHWDTLALFPLGGFALATQFATSALPRFRRLHTAALALFAASALVALGGRIASTTWPYAVAAHTHRTENIERYRALLLSGRIRDETARVNDALARQDYAFFDDAFYRYAMPPVATHNYLLKPLPALALLSPDIIPAREPSFITRATALILRCGAAFLVLAAVGAGAGFKKPSTTHRASANANDDDASPRQPAAHRQR